MERKELSGICLIILVSLIFLSSYVGGTSVMDTHGCMLPWKRPTGSGWGSFSDMQTTLKYIGGGLAMVLMVFEGIKWMTAESPEDREDAKRGIIYIIIGLVMLAASYSFIFFLFCTK